MRRSVLLCITLCIAILTAPAAACWCPCPLPIASGGSSGSIGTWLCGEWARNGWQVHGEHATIDAAAGSTPLWLVVTYPNGGRLASVQTAYAAGTIEPSGFIIRRALAGSWPLQNPTGRIYLRIEKREPSPTPCRVQLIRGDGVVLFDRETAETVAEYTVDLVR
ncbi:MAG: hypothetical protein WC683_05055 [bacterium]